MRLFEAAGRHRAGVDEPLAPFQQRAEARIVVRLRVFGHRNGPLVTTPPPLVCIASDSTTKDSKLSTDTAEDGGAATDHVPASPRLRVKEVEMTAHAVVSIARMPKIRVRQAAELLGVSDDTVRRWIDDGSLAASADASGRKVVDGAELAAFARGNPATAPKDPLGTPSSARNRFAGLVTDVVSDTVMSQVEMQCGPFTVVSLMSTAAVRELGLEPGSVAVAVVKATTVIVETPAQP
ncbi:hypothetical protein MMON_46720 [Mycolicibacterium monacense]|uniref:Mop domain-containing protein n=2 Tax=Mycobacteriaceae TaxID=1762 RepID=A0AAD1IYN6_MYCMB|nr:hypothetical protein MMON_46720 [Mycolicibacterium monacense]